MKPLPKRNPVAAAAPKLPPATKMPPAQVVNTRAKKTFSVKPWDGENDGEKIIIYGETGAGKSTLASMAPSPVFIGLDDGGRKLKNPITGSLLKHVPGIEDFYDIRDVLHSHNLFENHQVIVLDTITILQDWAKLYLYENYKLKRGDTATSILQYGWNEGFGHLAEIMRLILQDCDYYIKKGKSVVMLAQLATTRKANASGTDFLFEAPSLYHGTQYSVRDPYIEWADHILKIGPQTLIVGDDKKASGDTTRAVYTQGEVYFLAKSRTLHEPIISFVEPADDSLWRFIFPEK